MSRIIPRLLCTPVVLPVLAFAQPAGHAAAGLFDNFVLHEVRIAMQPSDWNRLRANYNDNTYYRASLTWRNLTIDNIGVRSRGFGSRNGTKPGLKADFNQYDDEQEFLGLNAFVLKPNVQDPSMIHERLAMLFYPSLGLPAPRESFTRLYVNEEYVGLYSIVEALDKKFLKRNFGENNGYLYEYEWDSPYYFDYLGPDASLYVPSPFKPQTRESNPQPGPLVELIRLINQAGDGEFQEALAPYLDLKQFMTHLAVETFLAEDDGILSARGMANFYLYQFDKKTRFTFLVWDKDRTFAGAEQSIFKNFGDNVLARRALAVPEARGAFLEALMRCAALAGAGDGWLSYQIDRAYSQIHDAALADDHKLCPDALGALQPCSMVQFEDGVAALRGFAARRADFVRQAAANAGFRIAADGPRLAASDGVLTPGSLASLSGVRLAESEAEAAGLPLPTSLGGVSLFINGFPAPLISIAPDEIIFQVPWEARGQDVAVTVVSGGVLGNSIRRDLGQSRPVIFAVMHEDGSAVTGDRPAAAGEVLVVRCTGLGDVAGAIASGKASPAAPPIRTQELPVVTIGGAAAQVLWSGLAPGFVGVYQVRLRTPAGLPDGTATPLVVTMGSQSSAPLPVATR